MKMKKLTSRGPCEYSEGKLYVKHVRNSYIFNTIAVTISWDF